jgi:hypothetical protein
MTDLIQQAEALESMASDCESTAENWKAAAIQRRAQAAKFRELDEANRCKEAAKLREQAAREPLRLWVNWHGAGDHYSYDTEAEAREGAGPSAKRIAVPMVEARPVRITPESLQQAYHRYHGINGNMRVVMEYALSLAGVEVEK